MIWRDHEIQISVTESLVKIRVHTHTDTWCEYSLCVHTHTDTRRKARTHARAHTHTGEVGELSALEKKEKAKQQSHMNWILSSIELGQEKDLKERVKEGVKAQSSQPPPKVQKKN